MMSSAGTIRPRDLDWMHRLAADWQLLADLGFSDVVLFIPTRDHDYVVGALTRPSTAASAFGHDIVGVRTNIAETNLLNSVQIGSEDIEGDFHGFTFHLYPIVRANRRLAVVGLLTGENSTEPAESRAFYWEAATKLLSMISNGAFPMDNSPTGFRNGTPRVADGFVYLNTAGEVIYASPNAVSSLHRFGAMGPLSGRILAEVLTDVAKDNATIDETLAVVAMGKAPWITEVEAGEVTLSLRAIPLMADSERCGAVLLCRDVSELRRHELDLMTKDATIREIHHRVKNNLQTVSALLRLQSRRTSSDEARTALAEAGRRVATIAMVHETLSQTIDEQLEFDEVFARLLRMAADVASPGHNVRTVFAGTFGKIDAGLANPLSVVLNELITNAVEHGLANRSGTVHVTARREGVSLRVEVSDDGAGIAPGSIHTGLGTQIVTTMVEGEFGGTIEWHPREEGGTVVELLLRV